MKMLLILLTLVSTTFASKRDKWQKPTELLNALKLSPDNTVCEIGAGNGYFTFKIAKQVKKVIAVDIDKEALDKIKKENYPNVETLLGREDNPLLKRNSCDIIFFALTYHHIEDRVLYLRNLKRVLKKNGRIINLDNMDDIAVYKNTSKRLPDKECRFPRKRFLAEAKRAGYKHVKSHQIIKFQYLEELTL